MSLARTQCPICLSALVTPIDDLLYSAAVEYFRCDGCRTVWDVPREGVSHSHRLWSVHQQHRLLVPSRFIGGVESEQLEPVQGLWKVSPTTARRG